MPSVGCASFELPSPFRDTKVLSETGAGDATSSDSSGIFIATDVFLLP